MEMEFWYRDPYSCVSDSGGGTSWRIIRIITNSQLDLNLLGLVFFQIPI